MVSFYERPQLLFSELLLASHAPRSFTKLQLMLCRAFFGGEPQHKAWTEGGKSCTPSAVCCPLASELWYLLKCCHWRRTESSSHTSGLGHFSGVGKHTGCLGTSWCGGCGGGFFAFFFFFKLIYLYISWSKLSIEHCVFPFLPFTIELTVEDVSCIWRCFWLSCDLLTHL